MKKDISNSLLTADTSPQGDFKETDERGTTPEKCLSLVSQHPQHVIPEACLDCHWWLSPLCTEIPGLQRSIYPAKLGFFSNSEPWSGPVPVASTLYEMPSFTPIFMYAFR